MNQPEREGEKDNRPLKGSPDSEQSQAPPEGGRSLEAQARPQGWLQTQALSAQMSVSSKHANRCLVEERNCRKITTPAVTSPTEPKTAHPSHALSPDGFPLRPEGAGDGTDTRLGRGPWGRTSPGTLENKAHPQTGSAALGENHSVFPLLPLLHPDPGGGAQESQGRGSFAPLYSDGKVKQGEFRDHQHQLKSRHFSPGPTWKNLSKPP